MDVCYANTVLSLFPLFRCKSSSSSVQYELIFSGTCAAGMLCLLPYMSKFTMLIRTCSFVSHMWLRHSQMIYINITCKKKARSCKSAHLTCSPVGTLSQKSYVKGLSTARF